MKKSSLTFKQMQRDRILETKPWEKSTGPKTSQGKETSKMNALKVSPMVHELLKQSRELFKMQKEIQGRLV